VSNSEPAETLIRGREPDPAFGGGSLPGGLRRGPELSARDNATGRAWPGACLLTRGRRAGAVARAPSPSPGSGAGARLARAGAVVSIMLGQARPRTSRPRPRGHGPGDRNLKMQLSLAALAVPRHLRQTAGPGLSLRYCSTVTGGILECDV
jgi:hypothetical protein